MKEDFLHYIWRNKKFNFSNLFTVSGEEVVIINSGVYLKQEGPDFFNAQIVIGNQKWAGNVEIHLKSSDWYLHKHEVDSNYESVILHVVWEHDVDVFRKNSSVVPVLELKTLVSNEEISKYMELTTTKSWIFCENSLSSIDDFVLKKWQESLFLKRLERKVVPIEKLLLKQNNDWESVLFVFLAKNFGLNINGNSFFEIASSIPFSIIRKEKGDVFNLEALFFGYANLLEEEKQDVYYLELKEKWNYLKIKYNIKTSELEPVQFFKLRPDNFPTIRLAQLAMLYHSQENLFSKIIDSNSIANLLKVFEVEVSDYWSTHYVFDHFSSKKIKKTSKQFIHLLIINSVLPIQFIYAKSNGKDFLEKAISILDAIPAEKNSIISKFSSFGIESSSAFETQSLVELKNEYCNQKKCLNCDIGLSLLK